MGELSKKLFDQIIQKQSLQVDTVSNATVTCNAYLKAIENALLKGK
ncbi:MAG: FMN-binding protein [Candidatus Atribacteria bacterium]|nr:FMN-binding protein [Candidatus Atribacteria bacterium]